MCASVRLPAPCLGAAVWSRLRQSMWRIPLHFLPPGKVDATAMQMSPLPPFLQPVRVNTAHRAVQAPPFSAYVCGSWASWPKVATLVHMRVALPIWICTRVVCPSALSLRSIPWTRPFNDRDLDRALCCTVAPRRLGQGFGRQTSWCPPFSLALHTLSFISCQLCYLACLLHFSWLQRTSV